MYASFVNVVETIFISIVQDCPKRLFKTFYSILKLLVICVFFVNLIKYVSIVINLKIKITANFFTVLAV